jgi:hypothetical protein
MQLHLINSVLLLKRLPPTLRQNPKNHAKEIVLITWRRGYDNNAVSVRLRLYANPQNFHQFSQMDGLPVKCW